MFNAKRIRIRFVLTTSILMSSVKVLNGMQTGVLKSNMHNNSSSRSTAVRHSRPAQQVFVNCNINIQHDEDEICFKIEVRFTIVAFAGLLLFLVIH